MRLTKYIYTILALALFAVAMVACAEEPEHVKGPTVEIELPEEEKPELPTYTIMYYASGGGAADLMAGRGLDLAIEMSIGYFERRPFKRNVKFTSCIKWSKGYEGKYANGEGNTYRLYLDKDHNEFDFELIGVNIDARPTSTTMQFEGVHKSEIYRDVKEDTQVYATQTKSSQKSKLLLFFTSAIIVMLSVLVVFNTILLKNMNSVINEKQAEVQALLEENAKAQDILSEVSSEDRIIEEAIKNGMVKGN